MVAGDLNGDAAIDLALPNRFSNDVFVLFNRCDAASACPADVDGSGEVGFDDLVALLDAWGPCDAS